VITRRQNLIILLATLFVLSNAAFINADEQPLKVAPANSLFYIQANNLDYSLSQVDQFLAGLSPTPMGVQMIVRMQLAQMLGSPALEGVNTTGKFAIFMAVDENEKFDDSAISILLPVSDYKTFISSNTNLTPPDANGISQLKTAGGCVAQIDSFAMIKSPQSYDKLLALKKSPAGRKCLADILTTEQLSEADKAALWLHCDMVQVNKVFGPQINAGIELMKNQMMNMPQNTSKSPVNPGEIIKIYADIVKAFLEQSKSITAYVNPKPDVLVLSGTATALPGTEMAKFFTDDTAAKGENKLLVYLQDGAICNYSSNITSKMQIEMMQFLTKAFGGTLSKEDQAAIDSFIANYKTALIGFDATTVNFEPNSTPPFSGVYVAQVADKDKFRTIMEESQKLMQTTVLRNFYQQLGMTFDFVVKYDVDNYKGVSIDSAKFSIKLTDPNSPEAKMLNSMYGSGFDYRFAYIDGLGAYAIGSSADANIKKLIDSVKAGGPKSVCSEIKDAFALLPEAEKSNFFATINILRMMKWLTAFSPMPMMPKMDFTTKSNIVLAGKLGDGKLKISIAAPKQHLMEVMQAFMAASSQGTVTTTEPNNK
jgi:hypothetical protein